MIYRSNLSCPDLSPHFRLKEPAIQIMGHDIPSDPDFEPECGYWSHDEAAILYNVAKQVKWRWVDIGARFGWTAAHIVEAGLNRVECVDPHFHEEERYERFREARRCGPASAVAGTAEEFFAELEGRALMDGAVIDGNHDAPEPTNDCKGFLTVAKPDCVVMLHDLWGKPVQEAAQFLIEQGFRCRVYRTPNGVACLWRGLLDFVPPAHVPDPAIEWRPHLAQLGATLDLKRCG